MAGKLRMRVVLFSFSPNKEEMGHMKANRKFVEEEAGVSAVIGVILMVAITVAIAATVYVYVSGMIGTGPETTPTLIFQQNDADDYLMVTGTGGQKDLNWSNVIINAIDDGAYNLTNCSKPTSGTITATDRITFGEFTGILEVTMYWGPTNGMIGSWKFT